MWCIEDSLARRRHRRPRRRRLFHRSFPTFRLRSGAVLFSLFPFLRIDIFLDDAGRVAGNPILCQEAGASRREDLHNNYQLRVIMFSFLTRGKIALACN